MKYNFNYLLTATYLADIEIEDIGNCIIECNTDSDIRYIIWINTKLGSTKIIEFGPYVNETLKEIKEFQFKYTKINYTENKIISIVKKFLNNSKYGIITQAKEITEEELKQNYKIDLFCFMEED